MCIFSKIVKFSIDCHSVVPVDVDSDGEWGSEQEEARGEFKTPKIQRIDLASWRQLGNSVWVFCF